MVLEKIALLPWPYNYDILETKLSNKDNNRITCALYLDLANAFDTVDCKILFKKWNAMVFEVFL